VLCIGADILLENVLLVEYSIIGASVHFNARANNFALSIVCELQPFQLLERLFICQYSNCRVIALRYQTFLNCHNVSLKLGFTFVTSVRRSSNSVIV
jgi:hypothetical protein